MKYIVENSLENFPAWSGGEDTLNNLTSEEIHAVEEHIENMFEETPTDTQINDFLWFERDYINREILGKDEDDDE